MLKNGLTRAIALALVAPAATAQNVDLSDPGFPGFRIEGAAADDRLGISVSGAGDVNGDGLADLIVGAPYADPMRSFNTGNGYVVFGKPDGAAVDLANLGSGGFEILGGSFNGYAALSVSGAGDVNGDGFSDLIVGAVREDPLGREDAGASYVVFGKTDATAVRLSVLDSGGFQIAGAADEDISGISVSGAGDVNGDGLDDLLIGASSADPGGNTNAGSAFVVFGKTDSQAVDLANLGGNGFRIDGASSGERVGFSVAGAGDVNGDGLADLIIGTFGLYNLSSGRAYVVFGKQDSNPVSTGSLGSSGFPINGATPGDYAGKSVSGAGDVNGDGLADVVVGADEAPVSGQLEAGSSFVVFGKTDSSPISLGALGGGGFRINGAAQYDSSGDQVAGAGDVNGDGFADLIVAAPGAGPGGNVGAGASFVVFGKQDASPVALGSLGNAGFRIDGEDSFDGSGESVASAGDVNGDGLADLIVGAPFSDPGGKSAAGTSYVVFSQSVGSASATYETQTRNNNAPRAAVGVIGDGSNASHPDSRVWVDFADGNDFSGDASTLRATLSRNAGFFTRSAATVSWELSTNRFNWSSAEVRFRYLDSELQSGLNESALQLVYSSDGNSPFIPLATSVVNPIDNTISAVVDQLGFFYLQEADLPELIFVNGFEDP